MKTKTLSTDALAALSTATFEGDIVRFPKQLDRKVYVEVNKALEALGGKWNRGKMGHVFSGVPHTAQRLVEDLLSAEGYVDKKKELGQFFTPAAVADLLVKLAGVQPRDRVLEPSAGRGALAIATLRARMPIDLTLIEIDPDNCAHLRMEEGFEESMKSSRVILGDFLTVGRDIPAPANFAFDRIIMNPPFAKGAGIAHVMHAWRFLAPGGRLVSVLDAGVTFRDDNKTQDFRVFVSNFSRLSADVRRCSAEIIGLGARQEGHFLVLPERTFFDAGTNVRTVVIVLEKPR